MRKNTIIATISFLLLVTASCSNGPGSGPTILPREEFPVTNISTENTSDEAGRVVLSYQLGPFNLPAKTAASDMLARPASMQFNVKEAVWIKSFEPTIEDSEGNPLPNHLVHQILLINHGEENTFCTTKQTGNPFAAASSSMEKIELPEDHGYSVVPSDPLEAKVVLKNPTAEDFFGVFVKFTLTGETSADTSLINDIKPMMVDLDPCEHKPISIAPGQFVEKTGDVFVPEAGSIVKAYGLLQDYGVSITMTASGGDEPFWEGLAEINEDYQIIGLPPFEDPAGIAVNRGDKLSLVVAYNNGSDNWYDDATGAAITYLARIGGAEEEPEKETPAATDVQTKLLSSGW